jgi:hypothetical protein
VTTSGTPTSRLTEAEAFQGYLEMWKQTVTVQQHFNELCWKIRGLALTALTFTLGAASLTASTSNRPAAIPFWGYDVEGPAIILLVGVVIWLAFFFIDANWYHKLLKASVDHAASLEDELQHYIPEAGLTGRISAASPSRLWLTHIELRSTHKLRLYYWVVTAVLAGLALVVQLGS